MSSSVSFITGGQQWSSPRAPVPLAGLRSPPGPRPLWSGGLDLLNMACLHANPASVVR
ncbi:hypothetical protein NHX12_018431, partial [Muraenolepis orangiensis]